MSPKELLYYAMGQMAYAIAGSDGKVQKTEKEKFLSIINAELQDHHMDFDFAGIIFQLLEKDKVDVQTAYDWAVHQFRLNGHYLSEKMKLKFISIIRKIALAFPPIEDNEKEIIAKFESELLKIKGDPTFTGE